MMFWNLTWKLVALLCIGIDAGQDGDTEANVKSNVDIEGTKLNKYIYWDIIAANSLTSNDNTTGQDGQVENGDELVEDDDGPSGKRKVTSHANKFWPYGIVPYMIEKSGKYAFKNFDKAAAVIDQAIEGWMEATCLVFVNINDPNSVYNITQLGHKNYLQFRTANGCSSFVGFTSNSYQGQNVNLNEMGCLKHGIVSHEIGHAIGFYHEQSRKDRNESIEIIWHNIKQKFDGNFEAFETTYEAEYDMGSVMHYGRKAFTNNGADTIQALDKNLNFLLGNEDHLSFYDIKAANNAYKCHGDCNISAITCENDAFVRLINDSCVCVCPSVLQGATCGDIHSTWTDTACNAVVMTLNKTDSYEILSPNFPLSYGNVLCGWIVKNPYGINMTISLTLNDIPRNTRTHKCYHSVEVRYNLIAQSGPSFCGTTSVPYLIQSHRSTVMVLLHGSDVLYKGHYFTVNVSTGMTSACLPNPCESSVESCMETGGGEYNCTCHENLSGANCSIVDTILCNFDKPEGPLSLCLFTRSPVGQFNWTVNHGPTLSSGTGPSHDMSGDGVYLYMEASHPALTGWTAILDSAVISSDGHKCLSFYYHMYGNEMSQLFVTVISTENPKHKVIWQKQGDQSNKWHLENITVSSAVMFTVEVKAVRGNGYKSDIAIDSVLVTNGNCSHETAKADIDYAINNCPEYLSGPDCETVDTANCTFDVMDTYMGWCIFSNSLTDNYDWLRKSGETSSSQTGPSGDTPTGKLYYLYAEASKIKPKAVTIIYTPSIKAGDVCVELFYHMYGWHMGSMKILFEDTNGTVTELYKFGNQHNKWHNAHISLTSEHDFKISIMSIRGHGFRSDIAIDMFTIARELCTTAGNILTLPSTPGADGNHPSEELQ